ncbi:MAG: serine/threonine protein phosphatase [Hymenobacteraceae bacterium]|nr:serine/threonine protein phosphatase [Hymenobacteraceae bacterium]
MARYAIGDIHGCLVTFKALLNKINLNRYDELYLLGDYINKGPDSKGVLDYLMQLQREGYQLHCIRGNHDQFLIDACEKGDDLIALPAEDRELTLKSFGVKKLSQIPADYITFLKRCPLILELPDFVLVHGGLNFSLPNPLHTSATDILNLKQIHPDRSKLNNRILLHGHLPIPVQQIKSAVQTKDAAVNLDGGCVYYRNRNLSRLIALNLDNFKLTVQINAEMPYKIKIK